MVTSWLLSLFLIRNIYDRMMGVWRNSHSDSNLRGKKKKTLTNAKTTKNIKDCILLFHLILNKYLLSVHHVSDVPLSTEGPGKNF